MEGITEFQVGEDRICGNGGSNGEPCACGLGALKDAGIWEARRRGGEKGSESGFPCCKPILGEVKARVRDCVEVVL
jgi:hypothetical protein